MTRRPVGKITKHAEMLRVARGVVKHANDPVWVRSQLAPHERPERPPRIAPSQSLRPTKRMEAVQRMVAEQSSANEGFSDPREGLNDLFRLPQRSEAYPFEAQAWTKELALQMVTHPSAKAVSVGIAPHNLRLAFYGRRLLSLHFQLFLLEASRHAGPAAIAAGGGYFANPIPTRTTGSSENCMSARGDGTAQGLEDALLGDDGVLGRYLGYAWSIKEMANWRYKQGYDSRAVIVQSMVGGLAHAYGTPVTQRIFLVDMLPRFQEALPAWLQEELKRQVARVVKQGGVWGPAGSSAESPAAEPSAEPREAALSPPVAEATDRA